MTEALASERLGVCRHHRTVGYSGDRLTSAIAVSPKNTRPPLLFTLPSLPLLQIAQDEHQSFASLFSGLKYGGPTTGCSSCSSYSPSHRPSLSKYRQCYWCRHLQVYSWRTHSTWDRQRCDNVPASKQVAWISPLGIRTSTFSRSHSSHSKHFRAFGNTISCFGWAASGFSRYSFTHWLRLYACRLRSRTEIPPHWSYRQVGPESCHSLSLGGSVSIQHDGYWIDGAHYETNQMRYVRLGKSGLKISKIILGCMSYGLKECFGWALEEDEALGHIKLAYDLGINAFDTANVYSNGESERILGKAIKKYNLPRDEIVIMTKVHHLVGRTPQFVNHLSEADKDKQRYVNQYGLSRKHIFDSVKHSLERLQLDYIDLLQCHRIDPNTPIEETMQALHDVVKAGYVRYIGMSSCYAWQFYKMQSYAREHGLTEFVSVQNLYNPIYREEEREMLPMLQDLGVGVIPWSPLAGGFLARPFNAHKQKETATTRGADDQFFTVMTDTPEMPLINQRIEEVAKAHKVSMAQVTLAWSLSKDFITAPIYGTSSIDKLKDALGAVSLQLTPEEIKSIDEAYRPRSIFPANL